MVNKSINYNYKNNNHVKDYIKKNYIIIYLIMIKFKIWIALMKIILVLVK